MIKLGIIGYPLKHSLSPIMHNPALKHTGIEGSYQPFETKPENLELAVKDFISRGYSGYNVTIPFKIDIIKYLDNITEEAKAAGAVNTVIISPSGKTLGDNTDVYGFMAAFDKDDFEFLTGKNAAIIGSGGAARAVGTALIKMNLAKITIFSRTFKNTAATVETLNIINHNNISIIANTIDNIDIDNVDLLINCSPVGMYPDTNKCPVEKKLIDQLNPDCIVYDLIYRPQETLLIKYARSNNLKTISGDEMLVQQGAMAFEKWTNKKAPINIMREKLLEALNNETR
ncbi:MAG: shikimate dehydrogenase [Cyanobacteriota bacterium]